MSAGAPVLDRATAELVYSLSVDAADWTPKRYGYRVGSLGFLVAERTRSEVVRSPNLAQLPHTPAWLLGVMNLRGNLVPVADLRALCGEPASGRGAPTVLVLDGGESAVGIPIDGLPVALSDLRALPEAPAVPAQLARHARTAFEGNGQTWLEFEYDDFFRALSRGAGVQS